MIKCGHNKAINKIKYQIKFNINIITVKFSFFTLGT